MDRAERRPHPATRMVMVLNWWMEDHFDRGRNPRIEERILALLTEIEDQIAEEAITDINRARAAAYSHPECPFHYCDAPSICQPDNRCRHNLDPKSIE